MQSKYLVLLGLLLCNVPAGPAQQGPSKESITCRAMEVFESPSANATAVIFHQRDKTDGPRLGELLLAHSGEEVEFETADGRRHPATVGRVKSCFGRGLLIFAAKEGKLAAHGDFVLHFSAGR